MRPYESERQIDPTGNSLRPDILTMFCCILASNVRENMMRKEQMYAWAARVKNLCEKILNYIHNNSVMSMLERRIDNYQFKIVR